MRATLNAVHTNLSRGGMRMRSAYTGVRTLARFGDVSRRRWAARRLPDETAPVVPDDDGFLVVPPWSLPGIEPVVRAAQALRERTAIAPLWKRSDGRNLLRVAIEPLLPENPNWIALATDPTLLSTVTRYLGAAPLLTEMQLWISPYATTAPDGRPLEYRYHCDWADVRQLRVLTFVEDITLDHGPLTVIPAKRSAKVRSARRYTFGEEECTILDDQLFRHVSSDEQHPLAGPQGSLAFADTCRCFHQGSRLRREGLVRVMVMYQYLNVTAFKLSAEFTRSSPFARYATEEHSEFQRMVLGAGPGGQLPGVQVTQVGSSGPVDVRTATDP